MTDDAPAPPRPTRDAALDRLGAFKPSMARHYATKRNFDFGPEERSNVSGLSPHIRHRLVREEEVARAALSAHSMSAAEKFIQEVVWRTYFKGWLEMRPGVWTDYRAEVEADLEMLDKDGALREAYEAAVAGRTGIACFDAWARELVRTGYLHNHARMWFASIWIFTLELPWALGADFFLRHLMDGDAASNTLGWRWVGGLHTRGKTYLARASNINKYTDGRFQMQGYDLASEAPPLADDPEHPDPVPPQAGGVIDRDTPSAILLTDDDLHPESWGLGSLDVKAVVAVSSVTHRSPLEIGKEASGFNAGAIQDAMSRAAQTFGADAERCDDLAAAARHAKDAGAEQLVTMRPFAGPMGDLMDGARSEIEDAGLTLVERRRDWDAAFFPYADKGFFKLKKAIPKVFSQLGLT